MPKRWTALVFASGLTPKGKLPFFIKQRLTEAYKCYLDGLIDRIILSGGRYFPYKGEKKIVEAEIMAEYLISLGFSEKKIFLEKNSRDMISSVYFVYKQIVVAKRVKKLFIVISDFQRERIEYICNKILAPTCEIRYKFLKSFLQTSLLLQCYLQEKELLLKTQEFLRDFKLLKSSDFFNHDFYNFYYPEYIARLIQEAKVKNPTRNGLYYSLKNISTKKEQIFSKHVLKAEVFPKDSQVDFWSGRYLVFLGKDNENILYALKFVLKEMDKDKFKREMMIIKYLSSMGLKFVPVIVDYEYGKAPIWYLYKVIQGKTSGMFSRTFCFRKSFTRSQQTAENLAKNIFKLQRVSLPANFKIKPWKKSRYTRLFNKYLVKINEISSEKREMLDKVKKMFRFSSDNLADDNIYLSHGDLHPGNIIFSPYNYQVYFIDFEHIGYNNICFDFCFCYLFSWNNKRFQEKLRKTFISLLSTSEKKDFEMKFPVTYLFFLIWFLRFLYVWRSRIREERFLKVKQYVYNELEKFCSLLAC